MRWLQVYGLGGGRYGQEPNWESLVERENGKGKMENGKNGSEVQVKLEELSEKRGTPGVLFVRVANKGLIF